MFKKVLIANRGEIARRVIRTLGEIGVQSVAVYSDSDAGAPHVSEADEAVHIGPDPATTSYLSVANIIAAAKQTGADAIHPGYGFLSESPELTNAAEKAGITMVGPDVLALEIMGDKARSRDHVSDYGVPVVPGFSVTGMSDAEVLSEAQSVGFPLLIKPSAGGGGKGMQIASNDAELEDALASAKRIAISAFGDDTLVIERLISKPRHIEVQVFGDKHGQVVALGERECTLQRRHQKVIEEAPSLAISDETRSHLFEAAIAAAKSVQYVGAGTVEFLIDADKPEEFFFIEMNTRLQVEHPVTEEVTGLDLVKMQLEVAAGKQLDSMPGVTHGDSATPEVHGHAIEARIYAESPANDFLPSVGQILWLRYGPGVRIDSAIEEGTHISPFYDPMIFKMIATGVDRPSALANLDNALAATSVLGVETNIAFLRELIANEQVQKAELDTGLIGRLLPISAPEPSEQLLEAVALEVVAQAPAEHESTPHPNLWQQLAGWRIGGLPTEREVYLRQVSMGQASSNDDLITVKLPAAGDTEQTNPRISSPARISSPCISLARTADTVWASEGGHSQSFERVSRRARTMMQVAERGGTSGAASPDCVASMPGSVVAIHAPEGSQVNAGDALLSVEAMKMEHPVTANIAGTVSYNVAVGDQVQRGTVVAVIAAASNTADSAATEKLTGE